MHLPSVRSRYFALAMVTAILLAAQGSTGRGDGDPEAGVVLRILMGGESRARARSARGPTTSLTVPRTSGWTGPANSTCRVTHRDGRWQTAEVILDRSLGYGTYRFTVASSVGKLDPSVVLGLFTWSDDEAYHHREIDIEVAKWGNAAAANAQYAVQPAGKAANLRRFAQPDVAPTVQGFTWSSKAVTFRSATAAGATTAGATIATWNYTGADVPKAGNERTRINLWLDRGTAPTNGAEIEVVLSNFSFTRP